ncbi:hypothetical protein D9M72_414120 [compost metagenome]
MRATCKSAKQAKANASVGQWIEPACRRSSSTGDTKPSDSILTPVKRLICPTRIDSEMPAKKPVRIGRDRKVASTPSRTRRAIRHRMPTISASSAAAVTRSTVAPDVANTVVRTAANTVIVAASGPTMSWRDGPKSA